jgi:hypothetical protein
MTSEATKQERIEALRAEKTSLQRANLWYWTQKDKERAEYKRRRDRMNEIRRELFHLRS